MLGFVGWKGPTFRSNCYFHYQTKASSFGVLFLHYLTLKMIFRNVGGPNNQASHPTTPSSQQRFCPSPGPWDRTLRQLNSRAGSGLSWNWIRHNFCYCFAVNININVNIINGQSVLLVLRADFPIKTSALNGPCPELFARICMYISSGTCGNNTYHLI
jgi:hypothetical protein